LSTFAYTARSLSGKEKSGTMEAQSEVDLAHVLREQGYILTSFHKSEDIKVGFKSNFFSRMINHISLVEKMVFTKNLAVMIKAGMSITKALNALSQQTRSKYFSRIIKEIESNIQSGQSLGGSLDKYPHVFSNLYVNMVKVGETAGNLEEVLNILAEQMRKDHELISKVRGAMIYPGVILTALILIGSLMMIFVIPQISQIFEDFGTNLPFSTQLVINTSNFMAKDYLFIILGVFLLIIGLISAYKNKEGKKIFDAIFLRLPIFGSIVKKVNSARFSRTFSSLIVSGVPIIKALEITSDTLGNYYFHQSLKESAAKIQQGNQLSSLLSNFNSLYPPMVIQMLQVGEETGTLSEILKRLAEFYEEEVADLTKNLSSIIEPILMIIIGIAVGFFAVSMLQPIYSLVQSM